METLKRQVHRARQRVIFQQFLKVLTWSLFTTLIVAALGLAVLRIWPLGVDRVIWTSSWVGGAVGLGLLVAFVWTYAIRRGALDVAIEIDRRYGLKERVSSSLSLDEEELESEAGQALVKDAVRRIERIDVAERFGMSAGKQALLPLLPALVVFVLGVTDVRQEQKTEAATPSAAAKKQVKKSNQELKKNLAKQGKKAEELDLKELQKLFNKLEDGIDKMSNKGEVDKKKAMIKLNDLAKQLKKRRQLLGGSDQIKNQLNQLKNMKQGPADKMIKALKDGTFEKALDEIKKLQNQLKQGNLTEQQKAQLAEQMQQMQQKMHQMADAHEQAKRELQELIKQKLKAGDRASAGKLQQKLDRLNQQNQQMSRLRKMGEKLGQTSQSLAKGNPQKAMKQLDQLSDEFQDMQQQLDELEMLDEALDQFGQAKDAMNCKNCQGGGCAVCMGDSFGMNQGDFGGFGLGEGKGRGDRPEERNPTNSYNSRVRAKPDPKGKAVITDMVYGPNATGDAREQIKSEITTARTAPADPLTNQRLPRRQREQAKQYFDAFRNGRDK